MKLALNPRIKVLLVAIVVAGAGAAAWFLYVEEWLRGSPVASKPAAVAKAAPPSAPSAAPAPVASAPAPKPAAPEAPKPAAAAAPVAAAPAPAAKAPVKEAAKPVAKEPAKPKPAAMEPKPVAAAPAAAETPAPAAAEPPKPAAEPAPAKPAADPIPRVVISGPVTPGPRFNDLVTAVLYRDPKAVDDLIAFGKWPDRADSRGQTPLMLAVDLGDAAIAEALLKAGADPSKAMPIARAKNPAFVSLLERYGRAAP